MWKEDNKANAIPEDYLSSEMSKKRQEHWAKVWERQAKSFAKNPAPFNPIIDQSKYDEAQRMREFEEDKKVGRLI
jgi:hypothetical protein